MKISKQGLFASVNHFATGELTTSQKHTLYTIIMLYLFRGTDQQKMRKYIADKQIPFDLKKWAQFLPSNGVLLKSCKLYLYATINGKNKTAAAVPLTEDDRLACDIAAQHPDVQRLLRKLKNEDKLPVISYANFDRVIAAAITASDLKSYLNHFYWTKLRFLQTSYGLSESDLKNELIAAALLALYKAYPRYGTIGTMLAIAKTAIKNRGINIIQEQTSQSRNRLQGTRNNMEQIMFSIDVAAEEGQSLDMLSKDNESLVTPDTNFSCTTEWEESKSVVALRCSRELTKREQDFCLVIVGVPNEKFSAFLGEDNEEASSRMDPRRYVTQAARFFNIEDPDKVLRIARAEMQV